MPGSGEPRSPVDTSLVEEARRNLRRKLAPPEPGSPYAAKGRAPSPAARTVLALGTHGSDDPARVGQKVAALAKLSGPGFAIPPGFVVTVDAMRIALAEAGAERDLACLEGATSPGQEAERAALAANLRERLAGIAIPEPVLAELRLACHALAVQQGGRLEVVVRTSRTASEAAGDRDRIRDPRYFGIREPEALLERIREIWASAIPEPTGADRSGSAGPTGHPRILALPAVLVQAMVVARAHGQLITSDPALGGAQGLRLTASYGIGGPHPSGRVEPDRYELDARGQQILEVSLGSKRERWERSETRAGIQRIRNPPEMQERTCLGEEEVRRVAAGGLSLARSLGGPVSLAWALCGSTLYVLGVDRVAGNVAVTEGTRPDEDGRLAGLYRITDALLEVLFGVLEQLIQAASRALAVRSGSVPCPEIAADQGGHPDHGHCAAPSE